MEVSEVGKDEAEVAKKKCKGTLLPIASTMPVNMMLSYGMRQQLLRRQFRRLNITLMVVSCDDANQYLYNYPESVPYLPLTSSALEEQAFIIPFSRSIYLSKISSSTPRQFQLANPKPDISYPMHPTLLFYASPFLPKNATTLL